MEKGSSSSLCLNKVETFGSNYAPTLRIWGQNFLKAFNSKIRPALLIKFPKMSVLDVEVFSRKWEVGWRYSHILNSTLTTLVLLLIL